MRVAEQLKLLMEYKFMTLSGLSKKSGVSKSTISGWLQGVNPKNLDQLKNVADALDTTVDHLAFGESVIEQKNEITSYEDEINAGIFEVILKRVKK